jgi:hypothetical protein
MGVSLETFWQSFFLKTGSFWFQETGKSKAGKSSLPLPKQRPCALSGPP